VQKTCIFPAKYVRCRNASVLVLVLIVISAMTIVAFGLAYQTRIEIRLSKSSSEQAILQNLALSGLEAAKAILSEKQLTAGQTARVCRYYPADNNKSLFEQLKLTLDEKIQIDFWIEDESAFLDLNKSDSAVWENLPSFSRDKRACILDWIDTDFDTNPDGAEADYYERLGTPYNCKNASLLCLKELLFIKNITRGEYLGGLLTKITIYPDDIEQLFCNDLDQQVPFVNIFTTFGREKININTVSSRILSILPGFDQQATDVVLAYRSGPDGTERTDDDRIFEKNEDILLIEGLTELQKELLDQYCCFNSDTFRVFSLARNDHRVYLLMAVVKVVENESQVICVERLL